MSRAGVVAALLLSGAVALAQQQPPQSPDPIRVRIAMVPVDVRVVDRQGNPVTDLKQGDFTLLEDGVAQDIRHFSTQALAADPAGRDAALLPRPPAGADISSANRRVFLIMMGRGRHEAVVGGVTALSAFVRERLLPQDRIALMAWNRATDFTTDHALISRTVARYDRGAEAIEADLKGWFTGLRAIYGSKTIPPHIQRRIDAVFLEAGNPPPRAIVPGELTDGQRSSEETRRTADDQIARVPAVASTLDPEMMTGASGEKAAALNAAFGGAGFDNHVSQATETFQDLGAVYSGIEYLRYLDGEKHLVLFTESGLRLWRREDNFRLASAASHARIAVDTIHTGGIAGPVAPSVTITGTVNMQTVQSSAAGFAEGIAVEDLRAISELTGGQATAFRMGGGALDRIDRSTRFQYLLGYYPANTNLDGKFRKLTITVTRPGLTVLYRHGFYATEQLVPIDRRQFVTSGRVYQAGQYRGAIEDIKLTLKPPTLRGEGGAREVLLEMHVDLSRVTFTRADGRHAAKLNLAMFFGDAKQTVVGETWRTLDLNANDANRERLLREGTPVSLTVPVPPGARDLKVVVYDYGSDLLGTATAKIR